MITSAGYDRKWLAIIITAIYVCVAVCINPPTLTSSWISISAYTNPEVTYDHGLGEVPMKVDVQVRVRDTTQNKDVIFNAISSGHRGNDDSSEFGGVIYVYNANQVRMFAPGASSGSGMGKLVHLGGSKYVGPTITGDFSSGQVRVRLWKKCDFAKPTYVSDLVTLSNTDEESYQEVYHSVGSEPDLVIVQIFLDNDWVTDAQGISFYSERSTSFGGVVFAFGKDSIRLWTPMKGSGSTSNGVVFNAVDGWGNGGEFMYDDAATARIWAWGFGDLDHYPTKILSYYKNLPNDGTVKLSETIIDRWFRNSKDMTNEENNVQVETGTNDGFNFYAAGTAPTIDGLGSSVFYAGVIYGIMDDTIMMWHPDDTETQGCLAMVYGQWGNGNENQCIKESDSQIVIQLAYADVNEPPCKEKDCNPSDIGPVCVCNGTGYEGQYCGSVVQCERPTSHRYANYIPNQSQYDFMTNITFSCKNGYEHASGEEMATCNAYKQWNGAPYICTPKSCEQPEEGVNCTMTVNGLTFNEKVTYECASQYDVQSGDLERICQANQKWSGQPPVCARSCGDPNENSTTVKRTNDGLTVGVTATFECINGYEPDSGNFSRVCQIDATWSGVHPVCKRVQCGIPQNATGTNSQLSYNNTLFESNAIYTCDVGYHYANKTSFQTICLADRNWSPMSSCQKVICPAYPLGVKADITSVQGIEYGNVIEYECKYGTMLLSGTLLSTCQSDTSWSGAAPVCQDIVCSDPGEVNNGTVFYLDTNYNGMVIVGCDQGFAIEFGDSSRTCGNGGQWSGTKPYCGEVYQVFLNPVNGTPPNLPSLGIGGSPSKNPPLTEKDILLLKIPLKSTNRYKRTLYSVPDDRWVSKLIGFTGIVIVSLPLIFTMAIDTLDYMMRNSMTPNTNKVGGSGSGSGNSGNGNTSGNSGQMAKNTTKKDKTSPKSKNETNADNGSDHPI
ncbi:uncharacterized protein LOC117338982 [Pecten maximus]|uniref:uncharacterized protein LOC117338982 n=1 Tax=Pecten maximus TaxID=6579 RepID=UPI0014591AB5|nr:uncharacterized protein LOC117338982 [Pecten maximus]